MSSRWREPPPILSRSVKCALAVEPLGAVFFVVAETVVTNRPNNRHVGFFLAVGVPSSVCEGGVFDFLSLFGVCASSAGGAVVISPSRSAAKCRGFRRKNSESRKGRLTSAGNFQISNLQFPISDLPCALTSHISAITFPSVSRKKLIQRSWSGIFTTIFGSATITTPASISLRCAA